MKSTVSLFKVPRQDSEGEQCVFSDAFGAGGYKREDVKDLRAEFVRNGFCQHSRPIIQSDSLDSDTAYLQ